MTISPLHLFTSLLGLTTLTAADFDWIREAVSPDPEAAWKEIPWETSLLAGQARAAREQKPIFIWAMDGHPLGCT
ncbi:MAG: hypothetical protein AAF236_08250 [Verrucomicrobiota bacterium]